jgi:hypothetical protein
MQIGWSDYSNPSQTSLQLKLKGHSVGSSHQHLAKGESIVGFTEQFLELVVIASGNSPAVDEWVSKKLDALYGIRKSSALNKERIAHELEEMRTVHQERMKRVQEWERFTTENHSQFIKAIKDQETELMKKFPGLSPPIRILIHQQTANLLNQAWNKIDSHHATENNPFYIKLVDFMETVQQDLDAAAENPRLYTRPQLTISYMRGGANTG